MKLTDEARAAIATGWLNSSEKQEDYARQHGISPRALRLWLQRHAERHAEWQAPPGRDLGADVQKIQGDVDRLHQRVDLLQEEVKTLHGLLVAPAPEVAERHAEAGASARLDQTDHSSLGRPESVAGDRGSESGNSSDEAEVLTGLHGVAADRHHSPGPPIATSANQPPAGGMPDQQVRSSGDGGKPPRRKGRLFEDLLMGDLNAEDAGRVGGGVDLDQEDQEQHDEHERHAGSAEQATVAPAPEPSQAEVEPVRPIPMPPPGVYWG